MNVLSLFDGIGGAKIALDSLNIDYKKYFSSEIDKYALKVLDDNYKDIIHLGNISDIKEESLPKIDLLIGGSPCQDLSNAQKGKGLKGKNSILFYEYVRILNQVKPKYFVLENVKNKWGNLMSKIVGVDFIEINSKYFSGQNRPRYYWTNLPIDLNQLPLKPKKTVIRDIIEDNPEEKYFLDDSVSKKIIKQIKYENDNNRAINKIITAEKNLIKDNERQRRIYNINGKSPTLLARSDTPKILINNRIRKLTPLECERLQGLPDYYTSSCSDTQRYKMIGNGFTTGVISFILSYLGKKPIKRNTTYDINSFKDYNAKQLEIYVKN